MLRIAMVLGGLLLVLTGCHGPLAYPMIERLSEEEQAKVDEAWANLLGPVDRHERELLLDALVMHAFHVRGVDTVELTSTKHVGDHYVIMCVLFDRACPDSDRFTFSVLDAQGALVRHEVYTREDVDSRREYVNRFAEGALRCAELEERDIATLTDAEIEELARCQCEREAFIAWQREARLAVLPPGATLSDDEPPIDEEPDGP